MQIHFSFSPMIFLISEVFLNFRQSQNIFEVFVSLLIVKLEIFKFFRDKHPENIMFIKVTLLVSKFERFNLLEIYNFETF